mgnify:CR=1 FL=1
MGITAFVLVFPPLDEEDKYCILPYFWIPEEINLSQDIKDYPNLSPAERKAYDKILSFLVFLDSIQTANLPCVGEYITANEVNLCLNIQTFQECVHSQSYSYLLA